MAVFDLRDPLLQGLILAGFALVVLLIGVILGRAWESGFAAWAAVTFGTGRAYRLHLKGAAGEAELSPEPVFAPEAPAATPPPSPPVERPRRPEVVESAPPPHEIACRRTSLPSIARPRPAPAEIVYLESDPPRRRPLQPGEKTYTPDGDLWW